jgi:hypothetical protein
MSSVGLVPGSLNRWGRRRGVDDNCAGAGGGIAPGVGGDVVDSVGRYLRRVDQDVSGQDAVDECPVRQIVALVVMHDGAEVHVGICGLGFRGKQLRRLHLRQRQLWRRLFDARIHI